MPEQTAPAALPTGSAPPPPPTPGAQEGWTDERGEASREPAEQQDLADHPSTTWICENPRCSYAGKRRRVSWSHLGQNLYLVGSVRCVCGFAPVREPQARR